jgi:hypothetical protein
MTNSIQEFKYINFDKLQFLKELNQLDWDLIVNNLKINTISGTSYSNLYTLMNTIDRVRMIYCWKKYLHFDYRKICSRPKKDGDRFGFNIFEIQNCQAHYKKEYNLKSVAKVKSIMKAEILEGKEYLEIIIPLHNTIKDCFDNWRKKDPVDETSNQIRILSLLGNEDKSMITTDLQLQKIIGFCDSEMFIIECINKLKNDFLL